jgi:hypothetical protein
MAWLLLVVDTMRLQQSASKLQTQHVLEQRQIAEHAVRDVVGKQDPIAASWLIIEKRIELNDALDLRFPNVDRFDFDRSGAANW